MVSAHAFVADLDAPELSPDDRHHLERVLRIRTGEEISVSDGAEDLVVPAGTQSGRVFRLRGRGVPHLDGRGRGDLLVQVMVDTPTHLSAEEDELLRHFAAERGDEVAPPDTRLFSKIRSAFK